MARWMKTGRFKALAAATGIAVLATLLFLYDLIWGWILRDLIQITGKPPES